MAASSSGHSYPSFPRRIPSRNPPVPTAPSVPPLALPQGNIPAARGAAKRVRSGSRNTSVPGQGHQDPFLPLVRRERGQELAPHRHNPNTDIRLRDRFLAVPHNFPARSVSPIRSPPGRWAAEPSPLGIRERSAPPLLLCIGQTIAVECALLLLPLNNLGLMIAAEWLDVRKSIKKADPLHVQMTNRQFGLLWRIDGYFRPVVYPDLGSRDPDLLPPPGIRTDMRTSIGTVGNGD